MDEVTIETLAALITATHHDACEAVGLNPRTVLRTEARKVEALRVVLQTGFAALAAMYEHKESV